MYQKHYVHVHKGKKHQVTNMHVGGALINKYLKNNGKNLKHFAQAAINVIERHMGHKKGHGFKYSLVSPHREFRLHDIIKGRKLSLHKEKPTLLPYHEPTLRKKGGTLLRE